VLSVKFVIHFFCRLNLRRANFQLYKVYRTRPDKSKKTESSQIATSPLRPVSSVWR